MTTTTEDVLSSVRDARDAFYEHVGRIKDTKRRTRKRCATCRAAWWTGANRLPNRAGLCATGEGLYVRWWELDELVPIGRGLSEDEVLGRARAWLQGYERTGRTTGFAVLIQDLADQVDEYRAELAGGAP
jgi:hypothetical protein